MSTKVALWGLWVGGVVVVGFAGGDFDLGFC